MFYIHGFFRLQGDEFMESLQGKKEQQVFKFQQTGFVEGEHVLCEMGQLWSIVDAPPSFVLQDEDP